MSNKKKKHAGGRPSGMNKIDLKQVERLGTLGFYDYEIANIIGIGASTLRSWKKNREFAAAIKKGKDKADANIVQSLYQKAFGYETVRHREGEEDQVIRVPGDTVAMIFWLKNRQPDRWKDRHDVGVEGNVMLNVITSIPRPEKKQS